MLVFEEQTQNFNAIFLSMSNGHQVHLISNCTQAEIVIII